MKLFAGEQLRLTDNEKFLKVISGKLKVFAITRSNASFRQIFLMDVVENDAAYPALDNMSVADIMLYAATDAEVELQPFDAVPSETQAVLCASWFKNLSCLPWIRILADKGDDMLRFWVSGTIFQGLEHSPNELRDEFIAHEEILSALLDLQFAALDADFEKQIKLREDRRRELIAASIANLMDEEPIINADDVSVDKRQEETAFLVRKLSQALHIPEKKLMLPPEIAKKLDQIGILRRMAQKAGMHIRLIELDRGWHTKDSGVIFGYYGKNKRLAAFLPQTPTSYRMITTTQPEGVPLTDEIAKDLDKSAFICYAGLANTPLKARDLLKFILKHCWRGDFQAIMLASCLSGLIAMTIPIVTETVFRDIIPIMNISGLATVTQIAIFASFSIFIVSLVRSIAIMRINSKVDMTAEAALLGRLFSLPTGFFKRFTSGELVGRLMGVGSIKSILSGQTLSGIFDIVFSFWSFLLMCYYSMKLTAAALITWLIYSLIVTAISWKVLKYQKEKVDAHNKTAGLVQQIFVGLSKFRLQGGEEQAFYLWSKAFGREWDLNLKLRHLGNYRAVLASVEPLIVTLLLYYVVVGDMSAALASGKNPADVIGYPQFVAFLTAFTGFNGALNTLIPLIIEVYAVRPHIDNIRPILTETPEATDDRMDADPLSGAIQVDGLSFSYGKDMPDVLQEISFRVNAGENLAIVGRSGCGKSTLIRLLLGFEKPKRGAIYFDGQDLMGLNLSSVRTQMGVVLQNGQLMTGDIFTNIVGTMALSIEDAWAAAEAAGIADDIRAMPMGMQTVLSEGSGNISGGQRQRILIARALVGKPAIIIFDEATSALDNRTQAIVTESLKKMKATRIVVAHRLSTIRDADRILVLDKGKIAEMGSFDELCAKGGLFSELVKRQVA